MQQLFLTVLNITVRASVLICCVLLIRKIASGRCNRAISLLWTLVAIRLLLPFSIAVPELPTYDSRMTVWASRAEQSALCTPRTFGASTTRATTIGHSRRCHDEAGIQNRPQGRAQRKDAPYAASCRSSVPGRLRAQLRRALRLPYRVRFGDEDCLRQLLCRPCNAQARLHGCDGRDSRSRDSVRVACASTTSSTIISLRSLAGLTTAAACGIISSTFPGAYSAWCSGS